MKKFIVRIKALLTLDGKCQRGRVFKIELPIKQWPRWQRERSL
jgi:hypothetical protein